MHHRISLDARSSIRRVPMAPRSDPSCVHHLLILAVLIILLIPVGIASTVPAAKADTVPRATGAKDVGSTPGQVNYYPNGYPLKNNVRYTFNLSVSFQWDLSAAEKTDYQNRVKDFNAKLYDSTDGQMALEKIDMWPNQGHWDVADIQFYHYSSRAFTYRGGIDVSDGHIFVFTNDNGKVLLHEFGHYGLYFPDEYTDAHGAFCRCIQGTCYDTNEFCSKSNHCAYDPVFCHNNGEALSCWEQLGNAYPHVTVKDPPTGGPYDTPAATILWHDKFDFATQDANMTVSSAKPTSGDLVHVNVTFGNLDYSIDGSQRFSLYDNDPAAGGNVTDSVMYDVRDRSSFTIPFNVTAKDGMNTFWAKADPDNQVAELNENNNVAKGQVYVNSRPTILPTMPKRFSGWEDQPLTVNLLPYAHDLDDSDSSLKWNVTNHDKTKIIDLKVNAAQNVFTFTPKLYWFGVTKIDLTVTDPAGGMAKCTAELEFKWVNHNPTVTSLSIDKHSTLRGGNVNLLLRAQDIEDKENALKAEIEYKTPKTDWAPLESTWADGFQATLETKSDSPLGNYSFRGMVTDANSWTSTWSYLNDTFLVSNNPPKVLNVVPSLDTIYRTENATVQFTAQDIEDGPEALTWEVQVQGPDQNWLPYTGIITYDQGSSEVAFTPNVKAALGVYHFQAKATDKDGASTDWLEDSAGITVTNNVPVADHIKVSAPEVYRKSTIQVRALGKDVEQAKADLKPEFQYSSGGDWATDHLTAPYFDAASGEWVANFTPTIDSPLGGVSFQARFTDADKDSSQWIGSDKVQVKNVPPICRMDGPAKGMTGEQLLFHGSNSSDVEGQVTYSWAFGDGSVSSEANPTHKFSDARQCTVNLIVTDRNGMTDSKSIQVTISKKPEPQGPFPTPTGGSGGMSSVLLLGLLLLIIVVIIVIVAAVYMSRRKKHRLEATPVGRGPRAPSLLYEDFDQPKEQPGPMTEAPKDMSPGPPPPGPPKP
jgi:hypothetical protein